MMQVWGKRKQRKRIISSQHDRLPTFGISPVSLLNLPFLFHLGGKQCCVYGHYIYISVYIAAHRPQAYRRPSPCHSTCPVLTGSQSHTLAPRSCKCDVPLCIMICLKIGPHFYVFSSCIPTFFSLGHL